MDWQEQLISLYLFTCKHYQQSLQYYCERMTNFADLSFSDEEVISLFGRVVLALFALIFPYEI